jgi:hypothetical protein
MTPAPGADFAQLCEHVCPGFHADGEARRARKSELLCGTVDGAPVIAKRLLRPNAVWAWYSDREVAMYRELDAHPPGVRVPRFVCADRGVLVVERLPGAPLATRRRPHAALPIATVAALIEARFRLAAWTGTPPSSPPTRRVRSQLRDRLLEDPTAPVEWIRDGFARAARRAIVTPEIARELDAAVAAHAPIAFGHGDMLLRNVVGDGLVDWECAGTHVHDWDLALLWTQLAPASRAPIDHAIGGGPRRDAFRALRAFALIREVRFAESFRRRADAERAELAELIG